MPDPSAFTFARPIAIIGFPFDANSSYMKGAAEAPPVIREGFRCDSSNRWTECGLDLGAGGLIRDEGDLDRSIPDPPRSIEDTISRLLDDGMAPISLGGDHSITHPIVRAFGRRFPHLTLLHFDAHADLYDEFQGSRNSHGCPFARIMEEKAASRLVQAGIRSLTDHHRAQIRRFGVDLIEMKDWTRELFLAFAAPVYISVDIDVLDPAFAPGVSHHEPGGCSTRQLLQAIQALQAVVVGADIVEFNPRRDVAGITAMACAKIFKELAAKILRSNKEGK